MLLYVIKRLLMTLVVLLLLMVCLALLPHLVSGDPVTTILGPRASPTLAAAVRSEMGLDKSIPVQIWDFVVHGLQGDLGHDFITHLPVTSLIANVLPDTVILAVAGLLFAALLGIPLGVYAATRPGSWADRLTGVLSVSFVTLPSYVAGLFLLLIFALSLGWLPAIGAGSLSNPGDYFSHLILPAIALGLNSVGYLMRLVRSSMLEVLGTNYIRTAHALGMRERIVFAKYALRNAIIPTVSVLGVLLGSLMGSAVFVEVIFTRPGLGTLITNAITTRNYPIVRGGVLTFAVLVVLANLIADIANRYLDPRVRTAAKR